MQKWPWSFDKAILARSEKIGCTGLLAISKGKRNILPFMCIPSLLVIKEKISKNQKHILWKGSLSDKTQCVRSVEESSVNYKSTLSSGPPNQELPVMGESRLQSYHLSVQKCCWRVKNMSWWVWVYHVPATLRLSLMIILVKEGICWKMNFLSPLNLPSACVFFLVHLFYDQVKSADAFISTTKYHWEGGGCWLV